MSDLTYMYVVAMAVGAVLSQARYDAGAMQPRCSTSGLRLKSVQAGRRKAKDIGMYK